MSNFTYVQNELIEKIASVQRFGHPADFSYLFRDPISEIFDYVLGVILVASCLIGIYFVWMLSLGLYMCLKPRMERRRQLIWKKNRQFQLDTKNSNSNSNSNIKEGRKDKQEGWQDDTLHNDSDTSMEETNDSDRSLNNSNNSNSNSNGNSPAKSLQSGAGDESDDHYILDLAREYMTTIPLESGTPGSGSESEMGTFSPSQEQNLKSQSQLYGQTSIPVAARITTEHYFVPKDDDDMNMNMDKNAPTVSSSRPPSHSPRPPTHFQIGTIGRILFMISSLTVIVMPIASTRMFGFKDLKIVTDDIMDVATTFNRMALDGHEILTSTIQTLETGTLQSHESSMLTQHLQPLNFCSDPNIDNKTGQQLTKKLKHLREDMEAINDGHDEYYGGGKFQIWEFRDLNRLGYSKLLNDSAGAKKWGDMFRVKTIQMDGYVLSFCSLSLLLLVSAILSWTKTSCRPLTCLNAWIILPLFVLLVFVSWFLVTVYSVGAILNADFCSGGEAPGSPDATTLKLNTMTYYKEYLGGTYEYWVVGDCDAPYPTNTTFLPNLLTNLTTTQESILALNKSINFAIQYGNLEEHCSNSPSFDSFHDNLMLLDDYYGSLATNVSTIMNLTGCETMHPMYTDLVHRVACEDAPEAGLWAFGSLFLVSLCGMIMITLRGALKFDVEDDPGYDVDMEGKRVDDTFIDSPTSVHVPTATHDTSTSTSLRNNPSRRVSRKFSTMTFLSLGSSSRSRMSTSQDSMLSLDGDTTNPHSSRRNSLTIVDGNEDIGRNENTEDSNESVGITASDNSSDSELCNEQGSGLENNRSVNKRPLTASDKAEAAAAVARKTFVNENIYSITDAMESSSVSVASPNHTIDINADSNHIDADADATVTEQLPSSMPDSKLVSVAQVHVGAAVDTQQQSGRAPLWNLFGLRNSGVQGDDIGEEEGGGGTSSS